MESVAPRKRVDYLVLVVSIVPLLCFGLAIWLLWSWGVNLVSLLLFAAFYIESAVGITVGYHRLFTHNSFDTYPVIKFILGVCGASAIEGRIIDWVCDHKKHHQYSDDEGDPHSPVFNRVGLWQRFAGFLHAHYGWILTVGSSRDHKRYVPKLLDDPVVSLVDRFFLVWVFAGILFPAVLGGLIMHSWKGAFLGFLWGGPVRVLFVHHVTWSINSICHMFGTQPYRSHDSSRNNVIAGLLGMGEGFHNNHHAFPTSARHGLAWWQFDLSWIIIRSLEICGLAWNVRVPSKEDMVKKRTAA
jgi:stearoyl-CoA desaturase (delta-9 desaturase)